MRSFFMFLVLCLSSVSLADACCSSCKEGKSCESVFLNSKKDTQLPFKISMTDEYYIFSQWDDGTIDLSSVETRSLMTSDMIKNGLIDSEDDISFSRDAVFVKPKFLKKDREPKKCPMDTKLDSSFLMDIQSRTPREESNCKENCSSAAVVAGCSCAFVPPVFMSACVLAVENLRRGCVRCCEGAGFEANCINPLRRFVPGQS